MMMRSPNRIEFGYPRITPVVKNLLIVNTVLYFVLLLLPIFPGGLDLTLANQVLSQFGFRLESIWKAGKIWQFVTYGFVHASFWHLFWNLFALAMFGSEVESYWGRRPFLLFFLSAVAAGGVAVFLGDWLEGGGNLTIGASGGVLGVVVAYGFIFANREVFLLLPPMALKAKWLAVIWVAIDMVMFLEGKRTGQGSGVAYLAHFGGALFAFFYMRSRFRFSAAARFRLQGLTIREHVKRWKARRHLRVIVNGDPEGKTEKDRPPTYH